MNTYKRNTRNAMISLWCVQVSLTIYETKIRDQTHRWKRDGILVIISPIYA